MLKLYFCSQWISFRLSVRSRFTDVKFGDVLSKLDSKKKMTLRIHHVVSASDSQSGGPGIGPRICSRCRVQILGHACKYPTGCLLPVGVFNPVMLCCIWIICFEVFEGSACKLAGQAKCTFHYKKAFNTNIFYGGCNVARPKREL